MKTAIIIPARFASTRLPGKALIDLCGKPIIQHVYECAKNAKRASKVIIATDDDRIASVVIGFGGEVAMTRSDHQSGSERVAEATEKLDADIIINLQGDEPEIDPAHIDRLIQVQETYEPFASTLICPFPDGLSLDDPAAVKAVPGKALAPGIWEAMSFSRKPKSADASVKQYLHVGIYAFTRDTLATFAAAAPGKREQAERLEQLRILEMGKKIVVTEVPAAAPGIDTPEDLEAARKRFGRA